jgi:cytochrome c biogenesis protein CcdA/thiol-disulfide isomerase/thioredoxin
MKLLVLAYLGGVLTIISPCILPILPFVFARADRPFATNGLPMLVGMAVTFAVVAALAAVAGAWAVEANQFGRVAAMVLLALFGLMLIFPNLSDWVTRPLVHFGAALSRPAEGAVASKRTSIGSSFLLGGATGFLWAPCAGPVLGLILTGAALNGANIGTTFLLLAYAIGAATSLALALAIGGRVFTAMKRSLTAGEWIRRGLGVAVIAGVVAVSFGLDTGFLTQLSLSSTNGLEQRLVDWLRPSQKSASTSVGGPTATPAARDGAKGPNLGVEGGFPSLSGATTWLNSPPLTRESLRGKVVLIDFWTYSCINCLRSLPYVKAWAEKYKDHGLVVIGVHTPEFAFERNVDNVRRAVSELKIGYPVALDNDYKVWREFDNEYWPAHYFIDAQGRMRYHQFGEGDYDESERAIQELLTEAGNSNVPRSLVTDGGLGAEAPASEHDDNSPETYVGYNRADNFVSPGGIVEDKSHVYDRVAPKLNQWSLSGEWLVGGQSATLNSNDGKITYRFHARDLHLVLGPAANGNPIRFIVTIDGKPPGESHGADSDANGRGVIKEERLYQLVRQNGPIGDRTFEIQFLDPGVRAYAFTFG